MTYYTWYYYYCYYYYCTRRARSYSQYSSSIVVIGVSTNTDRPTQYPVGDWPPLYVQGRVISDLVVVVVTRALHDRCLAITEAALHFPGLSCDGGIQQEELSIHTV